MNAGRCLLEYMYNEGTDFIFGIPGGDARYLVDELYDFPEIISILPKHEQGAAFMAMGYAKASTKPGMCFSTLAPGAMNMAAGILASFIDSTPIMALTANSSLEQQGKSAVQDSSGWVPRSFPIIDVYANITKWSVMINPPERTQEIVTRAIRIMMTGRKGPVHLNYPCNIIKKEIEANILPIKSYRPSERVVDIDGAKEAANLLVKAQRPSILAGGGVIISDSSEELVKIAELLGAPVATTIQGRGSISEDHPLAIGDSGSWGQDTAAKVLKKGETDVLLAIGCVFSGVTTVGWLSDFGGDKIIHVDIDPAEIGKNYPVELGIVGDAKATLNAILTFVQDRLSRMIPAKLKEVEENKRSRVESVLKLKDQLKYFNEPERNSDVIPLDPRRVLKEIREFFGRETIFLADSGNNYSWAARYLQIYAPRTFIVNGLTHMGASVATTIGVKCGAPERTVVDICGNGSFQMGCNEVITASTYTIPVIWCILDDGSFGIIKHYQRFGWGEMKPGRYYMADLYDMDFVKYAEACHGFGQRVEKPSEIKDALRNAVKSGLPSIIDIVTDENIVHPGSIARFGKGIEDLDKFLRTPMPKPQWPMRIFENHTD